MLAALTPRAALLPESWETEFSIFGIAVLFTLIVVVPVTVMVRDYRRDSASAASAAADNSDAA